MAAHRKQKESFLVNNLVIVGAILLLIVFYWQKAAQRGAGSAFRSPNACLEAFCADYGKKRQNILKLNFIADVPAYSSVADINTSLGWDGMDIYLSQDDLNWLKTYTNHISLATMLLQGKTMKDWEKTDIYTRFAMARIELMKSAPFTKPTITNQTAPDKQGKADISIQTNSGDMIKVDFRKDESGQWKIAGFFGQRAAWDPKLREIDLNLPDRLRVIK
jgi:hypothetical protein